MLLIAAEDDNVVNAKDIAAIASQIPGERRQQCVIPGEHGSMWFNAADKEGKRTGCDAMDTFLTSLEIFHPISGAVQHQQ